jgi:hypothetical protein
MKEWNMIRPGSSRSAGRSILGAALAAFLISAGGLTAGCSSTNTSLVNMWRDPDYRQPMSKLLIIGIQKDQATRRNWEDRFAEELVQHGVAAVPSYSLFPGDLPDTQRVIEVVRREGYDGVVMTRPLSSTVESRWVSGYVREIPTLGYDPWYGVYYNYYRRVYEPGYVEADRVVRYEINLWSTSEPGRLVWTGTTESVDPTSAEQVSREISAKIVPELEEQGVLASR